MHEIDSMDLATQRRLINAIAAIFLVVAAGGVVWSVGSVESAADPALGPSALRGLGNDDLTDPGQADEQISSTAVDMTLALQEPLYRPPPPPKQPPPKPVVTPKTPRPKTPTLNWELTGTIIQPKRSVAILTDANGKTDVRASGEIVELDPPGVLVRKIDSDAITLELNGNRTRLQLNRSHDRGAGNSDSGRQDRATRRRNR